MSNLLIIVSLAPILIWWQPYAHFTSWRETLLSAGQITGLVGMVLMSWNFVLAVRFFWLEIVFDGLNRVYKKHHWVGTIAFFLLLVHPAATILSYSLISIDLAMGTIVPSAQNPAVLAGILSLSALTILMILTLFVKLPYQVWKKSHDFLGVPLILAGAHGWLVGSTLAQEAGLKIYVLGWAALGLFCWLIRIFNLKINFHAYDYAVDGTAIADEVVLIKLRPIGKKMLYASGQFLFLTVYSKGISRETHPFSIASRTNNEEILIAVKALGDYTETLKLLKNGTLVKIEGPYGRFNYRWEKNHRQIWIAGGIGVTPFRGMAMEAAETGDAQVNFFYTVKNDKEALFDNEFRQLKGDNFNYELWPTDQMGRITAQQIADKLGGVKNAAIFICGPAAMMKSLAEQFVKLGVKLRRIHTEEFGLY